MLENKVYTLGPTILALFKNIYITQNQRWREVFFLDTVR